MEAALTHVVVELWFRFAVEFRIRVVAECNPFYQIIHTEYSKYSGGVLFM